MGVVRPQSEVYFEMFWNRNPKNELRARCHPEGSLSQGMSKRPLGKKKYV